MIMSEEEISHEFRLTNIDENWNYLIEEINQNELISKKHKNVYGVFNFIGHLLFLISTVPGCISISSFASLVGMPIEIASSAIRLKIWVIVAGIKRSVI